MRYHIGELKRRIPGITQPDEPDHLPGATRKDKNMTITKKEIRNADDKLICSIGYNEQEEDGTWHIQIKRGKTFTDLFLYFNGGYAQLESPEEFIPNDEFDDPRLYG